MDRGTRRAQKTRIRARLRQLLEQKIRDLQQAERDRYGRAVTAERNKEWRRWIYRDEGKRYNPSFTYTFERCDCEWCVDSRRYRTLRELSRMAQDEWQWRRFGVGEGEEDTE